MALSEHYGNVALGVMFDYPAEWTIVPCDAREAMCSLQIRRRSAPAAAPIAYLTFSSGTLEKAAEDSFFTREQGKWVLQGRFAPEPALLFTVPAGQALSGTATCGSDMGANAASHRCYFALVSNGTRALNLETGSDYPDTHEHLRAMLSTFRFLPGI